MYSSMGAGGSANSWGIPNYSRGSETTPAPSRNYSRVSAFEMDDAWGSSSGGRTSSSWHGNAQKVRWQRFLLLALGVGVVLFGIFGRTQDSDASADYSYNSYPDYANYNDNEEGDNNNGSTDYAGLRGNNNNYKEPKPTYPAPSKPSHDQIQYPGMNPDHPHIHDNHHQEGHDTYYFHPGGPGDHKDNKPMWPHHGDGPDNRPSHPMPLDKPPNDPYAHNKPPLSSLENIAESAPTEQEAENITATTEEEIQQCIQHPPETITQICEGHHDAICLRKGCVHGISHAAQHFISTRDCLAKPPSTIANICNPLQASQTIAFNACLKEGCKMGPRASQLYVDNLNSSEQQQQDCMQNPVPEVARICATAVQLDQCLQQGCNGPEAARLYIEQEAGDHASTPAEEAEGLAKIINITETTETQQVLDTLTGTNETLTVTRASPSEDEVVELDSEEELDTETGDNTTTTTSQDDADLALQNSTEASSTQEAEEEVTSEGEDETTEAESPEDIQKSPWGRLPEDSQVSTTLVPPPSELETTCVQQNMATKDGFGACADLCEPAQCCRFDPLKEPSKSCQEEHEEDCLTYKQYCEKPPKAAVIPFEPPPDNIEELCAAENLQSADGIEACAEACQAGTCCRYPNHLSDLSCLSENENVCMIYQRYCNPSSTTEGEATIPSPQNSTSRYDPQDEFMLPPKDEVMSPPTEEAEDNEDVEEEEPGSEDEGNAEDKSSQEDNEEDVVGDEPSGLGEGGYLSQDENSFGVEAPTPEEENSLEVPEQPSNPEGDGDASPPPIEDLLLLPPNPPDGTAEEEPAVPPSEDNEGDEDQQGPSDEEENEIDANDSDIEGAEDEEENLEEDMEKEWNELNIEQGNLDDKEEGQEQGDLDNEEGEEGVDMDAIEQAQDETTEELSEWQNEMEEQMEELAGEMQGENEGEEEELYDEEDIDGEVDEEGWEDEEEGQDEEEEQDEDWEEEEEPLAESGEELDTIKTIERPGSTKPEHQAGEDGDADEDEDGFGDEDDTDDDTDDLW